MSFCPYCMSETAENSAVCPVCGRETARQSPPHALPVGAMLHRRYLVGSILGEGGFGITYIGMDTLLQVRVAIKEFFPNGMVNRNNTVSNQVLSISTETAKELFSKSRESFLREARTLAKFTNEPGVVAVRDFFEENHTVYIVMEYLEGMTLKAYLRQVGAMSPCNTVCLLMPVFTALRKIHQKGLIHRDISPDNIMLAGEQVKLLDFGAAREFADERSLSVLLKHGYAPLEQYRRHGVQGAWTDVYAICAVMYRCVTGSVPPDAPDRVFEDELKMPSELGVEADPAFEDVLRRGLAVKPDERIQSVDELLEALDAVPGIDIEEPYERTAGFDGEPPLPAPSAATSAEAPIRPDDSRLSEYVPRYSDSREAAPPPEEPTPDPAPAPKKKSRLPLIIGVSAAAAVVVIGAAVAAILFALSRPAPAPKPAVKPFVETTAGDSASSQTSDATEPTGLDYSQVVYPDLGSYITIEDGFLTVDESLFGLDVNAAAGRFMPATLFWGENHPVFPDDTYQLLCLPLDRPINREGHNNGMYVETVDLIFRDNSLVAVQYETNSGFNQSVIAQARERYGEPACEEPERMVWTLDSGVSYVACMEHYDDDAADLHDFFTQRYYSPDETPR